MKTIFITTKDAEDCYDIIVDNWFTNCIDKKMIRTSISIDLSKQASFNTVKIKRGYSGSFQAILPQSVNPSLDNKADYVFDLACLIAKELKIPQNEYYLLIHAGDLFPLGDVNRTEGHISINELPCSNDIKTRLAEVVDEKHIYRFRHNENIIKELLIDTSEEDISELVSPIIDIIEKE